MHSCNKQTENAIVGNCPMLQRSGSGLYVCVSSLFCDHCAAAESHKFVRNRWMTENKETNLFSSLKRRASRRTNLEFNSLLQRAPFLNILFIRFSKRGLEYGELSVNVSVMFVTLVTMISLSDKIGKFCFNIFPAEKLKIAIQETNACKYSI